MMSKQVNALLIDQLKFKKHRCEVCGSEDLILKLDVDDYYRSEYRCNKCNHYGNLRISTKDFSNSFVYDEKNTNLFKPNYDANKRYPYVNSATQAYVAAVNILAVEFLVKTNDREKYTRYVNKVSELDTDKLEELDILLSLNMHTSSLGAMITQGDYDIQKGALLNFLNAEMVKCPNCGTFAAAEYYGSLKNVKYYRCSCCATKFVVAEEK